MFPMSDPARPITIRAWPTLLLVALLVFPANATRAATDDPAFDAFWIRFRAAILAEDRETVYDLTRFPFMLDNIDHDRAMFAKDSRWLFARRIKRCVEKATPLLDDGIWMVFCSPNILLFDKVDGAYRFTEIGVDD